MDKDLLLQREESQGNHAFWAGSSRFSGGEPETEVFHYLALLHRMLYLFSIVV